MIDFWPDFRIPVKRLIKMKVLNVLKEYASMPASSLLVSGNIDSHARTDTSSSRVDIILVFLHLWFLAEEVFEAVGDPLDLLHHSGRGVYSFRSFFKWSPKTFQRQAKHSRRGLRPLHSIIGK